MIYFCINVICKLTFLIFNICIGRIDIDFDKEPIGKDSHDKEIFLKDIWPSRNEVQEIERRHVIPSVFKLVSNRLNFGNKEWSAMNIPNHPEQEHLYQWNASSTYIRAPRYMQVNRQCINGVSPLRKCSIKAPNKCKNPFMS